MAFPVFGFAYAVDGDAGISDNWVGMLGAFALLGGLAASLVAFLWRRSSASEAAPGPSRVDRYGTFVLI